MTQLSFEAFEEWKARARPAGSERGLPAPRRAFLGWGEGPLQRAARWILDAYGSELGDVVVALPGARAVRRLQELLARLAPPDATPPRVLTQGALTDVLVQSELSTAGRLVRTLAWERALRELSADLAARLSRAPGDGGSGGPAVAQALRERLRLAETLRALHGELAPEGLDFASALERRARPEIEAEAARWEALAQAQRSYRELLARHELCDPHDARRRALQEGQVDRSLWVVLVGVADMNELLARALALVAERVSALIVAPPEEADAFDELGRLCTQAWLERDVPFERARWRVREKPVDQADAACEIVAAWDGRFAAHEVRLGIADEAVVPYLERRLASAGVRARHAAGTPLSRSRPFRLLRAIGRYLRRGSFAELAALARDVDLAEALVRAHAGPAALDRYQREHLPASGRGPWIEGPTGAQSAGHEAREQRDAQAVARLQADLDRLLGVLASDAPRALPAWAAPLRALLVAVYGRSLDPALDAEHALAEALRILGTALGELEEVPAGLAGQEVDAATAIDLVLRSVQRERVPPAPARAGERVVELLGWLDLPLDDAPALIVTGFNEGQVPQSAEGHAFLPDGLRRRLGLPGGDERLARDAFATSVLARSRPELAFVTGRRSAQGDPLVPSRLAFRCPAEEVVARVRAFLGQETEPTPAALVVKGEERDSSCARPDSWETPTRLSVSSFGTYLTSPYLFFLRHVLRLDTQDDRARELDPARFGTLAHDVLQAFGERGPRDATDAGTIREFLRAEVARAVAARFGAAPLPAVLLQEQQLAHRLGIFAERQAEHRRAGWRIHLVEWKPDGPAAVLAVDDTPMQLSGKLDRIDVRDDGGWAIVDYKTGEAHKGPQKAHRRQDGSWKSLQLPLYRHLARELGLDGEPWLGFFALGQDEQETGFQWARWTPEDVALAIERARDVVRDVRAGKFWVRGDAPWDEIPRAIFGEGTIASGRGSET